MNQNKKENEVQIFFGNSNVDLVKEVCEFIEKEEGIACTPGSMKLRRFNDGEIWCQIRENVRQKRVFVMQSTSAPVNEHLMELFIIVDALRRASAGEVNAVIPYFGYGRQDRKVRSRVPISAALIVKIVETCGVDRVITLDLHSGQTQGFFSSKVPCSNLKSRYVLADRIVDVVKDLSKDKLRIVAPHSGAVEKADKFRNLMVKKHNFKCVEMAVINKLRNSWEDGEYRMELIGDVEGCDVILLDDIADGCKTVCRASKLLVGNGKCNRVFACVTHGVFSKDALEMVENCDELQLIVTTNSIPQEERRQRCSKLVIASIAPTLGKAIMVVKNNESMGKAFQRDRY